MGVNVCRPGLLMRYSIKKFQLDVNMLTTNSISIGERERERERERGPALLPTSMQLVNHINDCKCTIDWPPSLLCYEYT